MPRIETKNMMSLPQPFIRHPETIRTPEDMMEKVEEVYKWMKSQSRFPNFTKNHAYLFLHACIGDVTATKRALLRYIQIRATSTDIFENRDIMLDEIQFVFDMTHMVALPKKTPEGYNILVYRLSDSDPSKMHFGNAVKAFCMFNDMRISEDVITEGYVVVFDMKGLRFGHLARVQFGPLRAFMSYIQEAHPVRLKQIYVVHASFFINQIMAIVKPLIRNELLSLLKFTSAGPSDILPTELLPIDYGGPLERLEKMHRQQRKQIETIYRQWLIETENLKDVPKEDRITVTNNNLANSSSSSSILSSQKIGLTSSNGKISTKDKFSELEID